MSDEILESVQPSLQVARKPIYDIVELIMVLLNSLIILGGLLSIPQLYHLLGFGFVVPIIIGFTLCSAPIRAVKKWRLASLLYEKKQNSKLLQRLDLDAPHRYLTLLGGAVWCLLTVGLFAGVGHLLPKLTVVNFIPRFFVFGLLLFLGPIQIGYILVTKKVQRTILEKK